MKGSRHHSATKRHNSTSPGPEEQAHEAPELAQKPKVATYFPSLDKVCPWRVTIKNTFLFAVAPARSLRISTSAPGRFYQSVTGQDFIDQEDNAASQLPFERISAHLRPGCTPTAVEDPIRDGEEFSHKVAKQTSSSGLDDFSGILKVDNEDEYLPLGKTVTEGTLENPDAEIRTDKIDGDQKATKKRRKRKSRKSSRPPHSTLEAQQSSSGPKLAQRLGFAECNTTVVSTTTQSAWPALRPHRRSTRHTATQEAANSDSQPRCATPPANGAEEYTSAEFPSLFQRGPLPFDYIVRAAEVASHIATELTRQRALRAERRAPCRGRSSSHLAAAACLPSAFG